MSEKFTDIYKDRKSIFFNNFIGGVAWSLGTIVGFMLLAVIIGYLISRIDLIPIIGNWLADILRQAATNLNATPQR